MDFDINDALAWSNLRLAPFSVPSTRHQQWWVRETKGGAVFLLPSRTFLSIAQQVYIYQLLRDN